MVDVYPKGIEKAFHKEADCVGRNCVVHNPSNHHMLRWDINIRVDRPYALAERMCPHGIGHPDPDSLAYIAIHEGENAKYHGIHGCDGCCRDKCDRSTGYHSLPHRGCILR